MGGIAKYDDDNIAGLDDEGKEATSNQIEAASMTMLEKIPLDRPEEHVKRSPASNSSACRKDRKAGKACAEGASKAFARRNRLQLLGAQRRFRGRRLAGLMVV